MESAVLEAYEKLVEENFQQDCFVSPAMIEQETQARLQRVLCPKIVITSRPEDTTQTTPFTV